MSFNSRLDKIEKQLAPQGCPACADRDSKAATLVCLPDNGRDTDNDAATDKWLHLYFSYCRKCGAQRQWADLVTLATSLPTPQSAA